MGSDRGAGERDGYEETRSHAEKRLLLELHRYLKGLMTMQNLTSNEVYVVALGQDPPDWSSLSFKDTVVERDRYYHPVGGKRGGWPRTPPVIEPPHEVRTGNIYRNQRVWCALDLLLTCKTIREARDKTQGAASDTRPGKKMRSEPNGTRSSLLFS